MKKRARNRYHGTGLKGKLLTSYHTCYKNRFFNLFGVYRVFKPDRYDSLPVDSGKKLREK